MRRQLSRTGLHRRGGRAAPTHTDDLKGRQEAAYAIPPELRDDATLADGLTDSVELIGRISTLPRRTHVFWLPVACLAVLPWQVQAQEAPGRQEERGRFMLEAGIVGDSRCPGRYVGINGQVVGPVSLYGMVETYRCADNTGNVISLPSRTVAFGLPVPLGDPRSSILGDSTARNLPEMPPCRPETASEPVAEGEHVLNLLRGGSFSPTPAVRRAARVLSERPAGRCGRRRRVRCHRP